MATPLSELGAFGPANASSCRQRYLFLAQNGWLVLGEESCQRLAEPAETCARNFSADNSAGLTILDHGT